MTTNARDYTTFSDRDLLAMVHQLAGDERRATARLIASLAELDARRLYLGQGCSSLFTYCTQTGAAPVRARRLPAARSRTPLEEHGIRPRGRVRESCEYAGWSGTRSGPSWGGPRRSEWMCVCSAVPWRLPRRKTNRL